MGISTEVNYAMLLWPCGKCCPYFMFFRSQPNKRLLTLANLWWIAWYTKTADKLKRGRHLQRQILLGRMSHVLDIEFLFKFGAILKSTNPRHEHCWFVIFIKSSDVTIVLQKFYRIVQIFSWKRYQIQLSSFFILELLIEYLLMLAHEHHSMAPFPPKWHETSSDCSRHWTGLPNTPPQGSRFFRFNIQYFRNITASGVHAPRMRSTAPPMRSTAHPYRKSWIRHCT